MSCRSTSLVASLALTACVQQALVVSPQAIEQGHDRLRAGQSITLETLPVDHVDLGPDQVVEVITTDGRHLPMRVSDIVRDCAPHAENPSQLCALRDVSQVEVGSRHRLAPELRSTLAAAVVISGLVALGYCSAECSSPYQYISDGLWITMGALVLFGAYVWAKNLGRPMT